MKQDYSSIQISFGRLAVLIGDSERLHLSALVEDCHVHGYLEIKINNRIVPFTGFWGSDDACFSGWIIELDTALETFQDNQIASHLFDEGEQGQPAFLFEREGRQVFLSIIDSKISDGKGDEEWQHVPFGYAEFVEQVEKFKTDFIREIQLAAPTKWKMWVSDFLIGVKINESHGQMN